MPASMKALSVIRYVLLGVSVALAVVWVLFMPQDDVDAMLYWCYALLAVAAGLIIVLPLVNMISNPKGAVRSLVGLAVVVVLGIITYLLGGTEAIAKPDGTFFDNHVELKISDMGLYLTYIFLAAAVIAAVAGEIRNALKR